MILEKLTLGIGLAISASTFDPSANKEWTLSAFAVALVIYLLWRGERVEAETRKWREQHLLATHEVKMEIRNLVDALKDEDG